jgi:xylan 1,4-beta-xylosidase
MTIASLVALSSACSAQLKYQNPILAGFYPDPSICRVGNDYYIVTSSFAYFPGLPLFHSNDLVNWKQIGHALGRNEQLDHTNAGVSRGLFAPAIRYNNGTFYIICTLIDKKGNFIITAKDPKGPWSNPVWLPEVDGIDPSMFFNDDGKTYITYNSIPPNDSSLYDGHRTIRMVEFDKNTMKVISDNKIIVNGGVDITKKPVWIEAPHIIKKDGWYYLICAEGGTGYNHSEVVFRSKSVDGPYIPSENNPILTQRHLDRNRKNPITTAGHADFVETPDGKWYAVFLACRPYENDFFNTGRETFLTPVEWKDGWPIINPDFEEIQYQYPVPFPKKTKEVKNNFNGNFLYRDDFNETVLNIRYAFLRNPEEGLYKIQNGVLELPLKPVTVAEKKNPAFIGFRQSHLKGYAETSFDFKAVADNEKAGLLAFQSEKNFYILCKSVKNNKPVIELYRSATGDEEKDVLLASAELKNNNVLQLKIEANRDKYSFYYSENKDNWILLKDNVDGKFLSTQVAGGFVGAMFAMYASSNNSATKNKALFHWFEYKGNDEVFK